MSLKAKNQLAFPAKRNGKVVEIAEPMGIVARSASKPTFTMREISTSRAGLAGAGWVNAFGAEEATFASKGGVQVSPGPTTTSHVHD